jgi:hypothetical protein
MHTYSPHKPKTFKQTSASQKADGNCFLEQDRSTDDGINATKDHSNVRSALQNTKKNYVGSAIQNKRHVMLTSGVVFLHDNARPHTAARTRALLEYFNCELFDNPPYSPDPALSDYHLFTYLKNGLELQSCSNNEEQMEGVETCLSSQAADFFDTGLLGFLDFSIVRYSRD